MRKDELLLLKEEFSKMNRAGDMLNRSFQKCEVFGVKKAYSNEELDQIEAFTRRFARTSGLLIQRIFRLVDELDLDSEGTMRDRINRAKKKGLIEQSDTFVEIRKLRNAIAHEYQPDAPEKIFADVRVCTPSLLDSIKRTNQYVVKYTH